MVSGMLELMFYSWHIKMNTNQEQNRCGFSQRKERKREPKKREREGEREKGRKNSKISKSHPKCRRTFTDWDMQTDLQTHRHAGMETCRLGADLPLWAGIMRGPGSAAGALENFFKDGNTKTGSKSNPGNWDLHGVPSPTIQSFLKCGL